MHLNHSTHLICPTWVDVPDRRSDILAALSVPAEVSLVLS